MSKFSKVKTFLVILVVLIGVFYASPNLFPDVPVIQLNPIKSDTDLVSMEKEVQTFLTSKGINSEVYKTDKKLFVKLKNSEKQAEANLLLTEKFGKVFYNALTIVPSTPRWLQAWGYKPITKGLDLRGGVSLLLQVDTVGLIKKMADSNLSEVAGILSKDNITYKDIKNIENGGVEVELGNADDADKFKFKVAKTLPDINPVVDLANPKIIRFTVSDAKINEMKSRAVEQNTITLRERMNSIGVAEPSIQREGNDRILVQLPGLSDPADAKEALTSTASLEYYLVDEDADRTGKKSFDNKFIKNENGRPVALKRKIIISGSNIVDASSSVDRNGQNAVNVTLDSEGASKMGEVTAVNIGKRMAVVYIDQTPQKVTDAKGKVTTEVVKNEVVISDATIRDQLSKNFQTTGSFSREEASKLARTLRSGALVAPVYPIEERTVGPSAGKENIAMGFKSVILGFVLVMLFMVVYYKKFGAVSVVALLVNVVLMLACLGLVGATLTLPGIAGIVLTMGMAVDANVLIYERIREELDLGKSNMDAIRLGFDNALSTIVDANITTFIAAAILFAFGTGPIQGFAVTLSIGILTSMFTAIVISRLIIHYLYERRDYEGKLSV